MLAPSLAIAAAGRALGSAVAQPALPQVSGSGVAIGSVGQFPVPHKLERRGQRGVPGGQACDALAEPHGLGPTPVANPSEASPQTDESCIVPLT
jgi:hypothetical protein